MKEKNISHDVMQVRQTKMIYINLAITKNTYRVTAENYFTKHYFPTFLILC